ncbi:hypothetical protein EON65_23135, partial [archaeon]
MKKIALNFLICSYLSLLFILTTCQLLVTASFPDVPEQSVGSEFQISSANGGDGFKSFRPWCSQPGPTTCATFTLQPYNRTTAADLSAQDSDNYLGSAAAYATRLPEVAQYQYSWTLFQLQTLPSLLPFYGSTPRRYEVSFMFRQHAANSVENDPARFPLASLSVSLVRDIDISREDVTAPTFTPVSLDIVSPLQFTSQTAQWTKYSGSFTLKQICSQCRAVVMVEFDSWPSYLGAQWYMAYFTLTETPTQLTLAPETHVSEHAIVRIPVIPSYSFVPSENCPHEKPGLKVWGDPLTWGGAVPAYGQNVTLPENSIVLLRASDLSSLFSFYASDPAIDSLTLPTPTMVHGHYSLITIPPTSSLVIGDSSLVLGLRGIIVLGSLVLGSPTCRLTEKVQLVFSSPNHHDPEQGILVRGGRLEMHGQVSNPPWVRLSRTAFPSNTIIYLQEAVRSGSEGDWVG